VAWPAIWPVRLVYFLIVLFLSGILYFLPNSLLDAHVVTGQQVADF
jgi:hypothetical protein